MEQNQNTPIGPWKLASGERVVDRVPSHVLTGHPEAIAFLDRALAAIRSDGRLLLEETVEMHEPTGHSACIATGPDDTSIFYARRTGRGGFTRFVRGEHPHPVTTLALAISWNADQECYVLETAYAGEFAPPEPYDEDAFQRRADPDACRREAHAFWTTHALLDGVVPWIAGTETERCPWNEEPVE